jgi:hypothetical protein
VRIAGGVVAATASFGSGIGAGYSEGSGSASVRELLLSGGRVSARSIDAAGVGAGNRETPAVTISGFITLRAEGSSPISGAPLLLSDAAITAIAAAPPFFPTGVLCEQTVRVAVLYETPTESIDEPLQSLGVLLQVGRLNFPTDGLWNVTVWSESSALEFVVETPAIASFLAVLPAAGSFLIAASAGGTFGGFAVPNGSALFDVGASGLFVPVVEFRALGSPTQSRSPAGSPSPGASQSPAASAKPDGLSGAAVGGVVGGAGAVFAGIGIGVFLAKRGVCRRPREGDEESAMLPDPLLTPSETRRPFDQAV